MKATILIACRPMQLDGAARLLARLRPDIALYETATIPAESA
jgi:hypothetical protein